MNPNSNINPNLNPNMNSDINPNPNVPQPHPTTSYQKLKRRSKKINFFPDLVPNYNYDSDDSLDSLSSGLPPPVRTSLQSLSNSSSYLNDEHFMENSFDRRNTIFDDYETYGKHHPPSPPKPQPHPQSHFNPYSDANHLRKNSDSSSSYYDRNGNTSMKVIITVVTITTITRATATTIRITIKIITTIKYISIHFLILFIM
jgi:hypothetical protein